jgi:hypothetical protein
MIDNLVEAVGSILLDDQEQKEREEKKAEFQAELVILDR